ncbi:hypothetical protein PRIPAC_80567 [Pristionchus pacificus]|uniref:Acyl-coenzyme A oxidase n=1 Tax=Pristionchus pacificus TaxID=54126 RepID=A0A2A6C374_PRIPA|nr:hypothetical protein PRIPAC_80567 [Pristionchus pacificus]|eukprot:PDM72569.1 hypothetical protein PRIPAC_39003 [Pristionchus pacificus]
MANHQIRSGDNPDLTKERKSGNFNTEDLAAFLYGSRERVLRRREISKIVDSNPDLVNAVPLEFLSREKRMGVQMKKTSKLMSKIFDIADVSDQDEMTHLISEVFGTDGFPLAIHSIAFVPVIQGQGHQELVEELLPRAMKLEIIGTYAQTEMGHGTNLRELETTATYDKNTEEFILHTPTRSSMKWWPGNMGKTANYTTVTAQLMIDGKNYGPHNFVLQLRDEKDHRPLPGITVGDIGSKMGLPSIDNGFLALDRVRIPRTRMLMKYSKVAPDGTYTPPIHSKLSYGSMVYIRAHMIYLLALNLSSAVTIATRYSAIRRQGRIEQDLPEVQVLDYQTQQYRIFPQIARAYAHLFVGKEVLELYNKTMEGLDKGETDLLPDLHAVTCGLKSVVSFSSALASEQCRMSCGGHGYSEASGLPKLYTTIVAGCTYEGENMVMLQQAARYLMKCHKHAVRGEPLSYSVEFLGKRGESRSRIGMNEGNFEKEIENLFLAFEHVARRVIADASQLLEKRIHFGESKEQAWNGVTVEMNRAARIYTRLFIGRSFHRKVMSSPSTVRPVLTDLLSLYLHYECVDMASHLLHDGYCSGEQINYLKKRLYEDLAKIRPNAVSLVDSFDHSDRQLNSVLGRRDGNVYEALFQWAKSSELNYTDVLPAFGHLQKMMEENRAKM